MRGSAPAKINLGLVVGPLRDDGKHEVLTVYQRIALADRIDVDPAPQLGVAGFAEDTLVRGALEALAERVGVEPRWGVRIEKRLPVAAGIGGGSSDAATALRLANAQLEQPLNATALHELAARLGADVPFFLREGPQLGSGDGTTLEPVDVPQDFWIVLLLPHDMQKESTGAVYRAFDERDGAAGWEERAQQLRDAVAGARRPRDLARLPPNDLAQSPHSVRLRELGAFHADVSGAGPSVYGLFHHRAHADAARKALKPAGRTWLTAPAWYG
ncbi:MAG: 4-(cytidine 5'-diphospho)-2-C-methyl-D-erythritol kinase [Actinomycetota bacterium]